MVRTDIGRIVPWLGCSLRRTPFYWLTWHKSWYKGCPNCTIHGCRLDFGNMCMHPQQKRKRGRICTSSFPQGRFPYVWERAGGIPFPRGQRSFQVGGTFAGVPPLCLHHSTQPKVRSTALSQPLYRRWRVSSSIAGVQRLSSCQLARRSSRSFQKPTARPAA